MAYVVYTYVYVSLSPLPLKTKAFALSSLTLRLTKRLNTQGGGVDVHCSWLLVYNIPGKHVRVLGHVRSTLTEELRRNRPQMKLVKTCKSHSHTTQGAVHKRNHSSTSFNVPCACAWSGFRQHFALHQGAHSSAACVQSYGSRLDIPLHTVSPYALPSLSGPDGQFEYGATANGD